jgi:hypothetical protein
MRKMQRSLARIVRAAGFALGLAPRGSRPRRIALITLVLVACLALAVPALRWGFGRLSLAAQDVVLAQVSASYDLSWHVIAGGGGRAESPRYMLQGTAGQPVIGPAAGSGHTLCSGFWCGTVEIEYRVYLPLVLR